MSFEVIDGCTLEVFGESAWSSDPSTLFDGAPPLSLDYLSTDIEYTKQPPAIQNQNDWRSPHPSPESSDGSPIWSPSSLSSDDHSPVSILDTPLSPLNSFPAMNIGIFQPQSGLEDPLVPRPSPSPFAKYSPFRKDLSDFDATSPVTVNPAELELSPSVDIDVDMDVDENEDEDDEENEDEDEDDPPIIAPPSPSIIRRCIQRLRPEPDYRVARRLRAARRSTSPDVESPAPHTWSPPSPLSSSSSSSTSPHLHTCGLQYIDDGETKTCTHTTTDREHILHRSTCPAKRRRRSPTDEDSEPYTPGSKIRKKSRGADKEKELFVCNLTSVVNGKEVTCTSTFTRNFDLERHRRLSRRHNADQMGECRFCGRVLSLRKDSMGRHHKDACVVLRDMRKHKALGRNVVPLRMVDKQARWVLGDVLERHWVEEFGEWHPIAGAQ